MKKKNVIFLWTGITLVGLTLLEIIQTRKALKNIETIKETIFKDWPEEEVDE